MKEIKEWREYKDAGTAVARAAFEEDYAEKYGHPIPKFTRRDFLKMGAGAVGMAGLTAVGIGLQEEADHVAEVKETPLQIDRLNMKTAMGFYERFDKLEKGLKEVKVAIGPYDLLAFVAEIAPYYAYEGLVQDTVDVNNQRILVREEEKYPSDIRYVQYTGYRHFHIGGQASCADGQVVINNRFVNPFSAKYGDTSVLATITHEIGHIQGICPCKCSPEMAKDVETATQLSTYEVLASAANHGNALMVYPLIDTVKDAALGCAWFQAIYLDRENEFYQDWKNTADDKSEIARIDKTRRYWRRDKETLKNILYQYEFRPFGLMYQAFKEEPYVVREMPVPNVSNSIVLDDLAYFLKNADGMVEWAREELLNGKGEHN